MTALIPQTLRHVPPESLHTPAGWGTALRALPPGPSWGRGDGAFPHRYGGGWLLTMNDTWHGAVLLRNTYVTVTPDGAVSWLRPPGPPAETVTGPDPDHWWWGQGAVTAPTGAIVLWGEMWAHGPGMGQRLGPAVAIMTPDALNVGPAQLVGLDPGVRWGGPVLTAGRLWTIGYDRDDGPYGSHLVASVDLGQLVTAPDDPAPWTLQTVTLERPPLDRPRLMRYRHGVLASGKVLSSFPGSGYVESPEVAAWWAPDPTGPYTRLPDLHDDTTRPGYPSYAATAWWSPWGLAVHWSRNAEHDEPYEPDGYGPVFAEARPPSWEATP